MRVTPQGRLFRCLVKMTALRYCFEGCAECSASGLGCCVEAAVLEVGGFVAGDKLDDAAPHPVWGVQAFGLVLIQLRCPAFASGGVHLTAVSFADDSGEVACCGYGLSSLRS
jgi:hypothetical protein